MSSIAKYYQGKSLISISSFEIVLLPPLIPGRNDTRNGKKRYDPTPCIDLARENMVGRNDQSESKHEGSSLNARDHVDPGDTRRHGHHPDRLRSARARHSQLR